MRLVIDCRLRYGVERLLRHVAPLIATEVDELTLLGDPERLQAWVPNGRNVRIVDFRARVYSLREQLQFPYWLQRRADLLHVPHYNVPVAWRAPLVITINDLLHLSDAMPVNAMHRAYARLSIAWAIHRSRHILTLSDHSRRTIQRVFGVAPERITVGACGVDSQLFHPDSSRDEVVLSKMPTPKEPFILSVGSVRPHKNLPGLLLAYQELRLRFGISQPLLVVGAREGFRLNAPPVVLAPEVSRSVHFCGFVPDDQLAALYRRCSVFVFTSLYEGFGLPPLEAMACGAPVVVSCRTSLPEVVGDAGLLVDPERTSEVAAAIHQVLTRRELAADLRAKAVARARNFTWQRLAKTYLDTYGRCVSSARGGGSLM